MADTKLAGKIEMGGDPSEYRSHRQITAYSIKEGKAGERLSVRMSIPFELGNPDAIAALVEAAAIDQDLSFKEMLKLVRAKAPADPVLTMRDRTGEPPNRPPHDWLGLYGQSAKKLAWRSRMVNKFGSGEREVGAKIQKFDPDNGSMAEAIRLVLAEARRKMGKHALPPDRIKKDANLLRQYMRS